MKTLEYYLERIASLEEKIQAWVYHEPELVKERAKEAPVGSLHGLPVALKDIIDTKDMPTCYGSAAYADHRPEANAWVVERLCSAGAVIMGKTVTTEFAYAHPGPTRNPHDWARTPGGSSSGSAAAVAADMVPVALGSQTGGSTIRPSAYCGVVGFKPSYGVISLQGVLPLAPSLDTLGIHSQSVGLAAKLFEVLGQHLVSRRVGASVVRVGWYPGPDADYAQLQSINLLHRIRSIIEGSGLATVSPFLMPAEIYKSVAVAQRHIMAREASYVHQAVFERCSSLLGQATIDLIETGLCLPLATYQTSLVDVARGRVAFHEAMRDVDVLMTLSAAGEAPKFEEGLGTSTFNRVWTALGVPCLTLPVGKGEAGLPLAVQLVASYGDDERLLDFASRLERLFADSFVQ